MEGYGFNACDFKDGLETVCVVDLHFAIAATAVVVVVVITETL